MSLSCDKVTSLFPVTQWSGTIVPCGNVRWRHSSLWYKGHVMLCCRLQVFKYTGPRRQWYGGPHQEAGRHRPIRSDETLHFGGGFHSHCHIVWQHDRVKFVFHAGLQLPLHIVLSGENNEPITRACFCKCTGVFISLLKWRKTMFLRGIYIQYAEHGFTSFCLWTVIMKGFQ